MTGHAKEAAVKAGIGLLLGIAIKGVVAFAHHSISWPLAIIAGIVLVFTGILIIDFD